MPSGFSLAALVFFVLWILVLLISEKTRREQLVMSLFGLILAPGALLMAADDFRQGRDVPHPIGLEDILFALSLFGLAAVLSQILVGSKQIKGKRLRAKNATINWVAHLLIVIGVWLFCALSLCVVLHFHSLTASIVSGLLIGIYLIADRRDLLTHALLSGIFIAVLVFLVEQIFFVRLFPEAAGAYWQTTGLSGVLLGGIPAEEVLWAAVVGFTVGPLYEYVRQWHIR